MPVVVEDAAFWRRLANCESRDGRNDYDRQGRVVFLGFFQFTPDTWDKAGGGQLGSYENQRGHAIRWAATLRAEGTSPGSTAGWPNCWWVALG